ncbi:MAG: hypothetical protein NT075_28145, partial [Chloroflexi bacterium]|nr:hypothetical protein [Chloroflexota bacterium]
QGVAFMENVNEVQLKLDPAGKPRLLIRTASAPGSDGNDYYYAACDDNCTQESGWSLVGITSATGGAKYEQHDAEQPQRSFALDPAGRPRFVYLDDNSAVDPLHVGVYYAYCDNHCTDQTQWQETRITELVQWDGKIEDQERALYLSLAFTPDGKPRLITAEFYPLEGKAAELTYFECDSSCDLGYVWAKVKLYARGEGPLPSADLAIDADGHPHVAFYQEKIDDVGVQRQHLWYATCKETNCMTPMNWNARAMAFDARNGGAPDLALDAQGQPRIAYTYGEHGGIGYSWCNANCESYAGQWQHSVIESGAQLQTVLPISYPANCDAGGWTGLTPTLVLPATGSPQVAYDATYYAHCLSDDNPNDTTPATWHDELLMRAARLVVFTQP